jgi:hypothetical protein
MEIISDYTNLFVSVFCQSSKENETHEKITYPDTPGFLSKNIRLLEKSNNVFVGDTMEMIDGFKTLIAFLETYTEQDVIGFEPVPVEYESEDEYDEETEILLEMFEALLEEDELEEMEEWVDDFLHEKWMEQEDREIAEIEEETRLLEEEIRLLDEFLKEDEEEEVVSNTKLSLILPEETEGWVEETYPPSKTEDEEVEEVELLEMSVEEEVEEVVSNQICFPEDVWTEIKSYLLVDIFATPLMAYIIKNGPLHPRFNLAFDHTFGENLDEFLSFAYHNMSYQQQETNRTGHFELEKTMPKFLPLKEGYMVGKVKDTPAKTWKQTLEKYTIHPPEYRLVNGETYVILSGEEAKYNAFVYFYSQKKREKKVSIPSTLERNIDWKLDPIQRMDLGFERLETTDEIRERVKSITLFMKTVECVTIPRNALPICWRMN